MPIQPASCLEGRETENPPFPRTVDPPLWRGPRCRRWCLLGRGSGGSSHRSQSRETKQVSSLWGKPRSHFGSGILTSIWVWVKIKQPGIGPQVLVYVSICQGFIFSTDFDPQPYSCGSKLTVPFWGRRTTHLRTYFSGDWDVHWGYDLDFDPWPYFVWVAGHAFNGSMLGLKRWANLKKTAGVCLN